LSLSGLRLCEEVQPIAIITSNAQLTRMVIFVMINLSVKLPRSKAAR